MTQILLTEEERIEALERFGYSKAEARFLVTAALHSGYFLRRQAAEFLSDADSGSVAALVEKVFENGHATAAAYDRHTHLYHLCTRPFYAAIGQEDNRNRRVRECSTIKNKLMALDFVLAHPGARFVATEQEKLQHFLGTLNLSESDLPARTYGAASAVTSKRYFVEKYPIFLPPNRGQVDSTSFCFVDEGLTTPSHFETFLEHYARLFSALLRFNLIYVAARPNPFRWVESAFQKQLTRWMGETHPADPVIKRLTSYFAVRRSYEAKDFEGLDRTKLLQVRNGQMEFSGPKYAELYEVWKAGGDMAVRQMLFPKSPNKPAPNVSFSTFLLEHNYDFFGTLTAI
jgi:hypothetical protein